MAETFLPTKLSLGYVVRVGPMEMGNQCFTAKYKGASKLCGHSYLKIFQQGMFSRQRAAVLQACQRVLLRKEGAFLQWQLFFLAYMGQK